MCEGVTRRPWRRKREGRRGIVMGNGANDYASVGRRKARTKYPFYRKMPWKYITYITLLTFNESSESGSVLVCSCRRYVNFLSFQKAAQTILMLNLGRRSSKCRALGRAMDKLGVLGRPSRYDWLGVGTALH